MKNETHSETKWKVLSGICFKGDCAYADGKLILPDEDGIYWWQNEGYYPSNKGRETPFSQGKAMLRPGWNLVRREDGTWTVSKRAALSIELLAQFYAQVCQRFFDAVAGYEGYLGLGTMYSYSAAPEIFEHYGLFPGLWVHGQMSSGKTKFIEWLMRIRGFNRTAGISLMEGTAVGLLCDNENYSNEPVSVDEYHQGQIKPEKEAILQDAYNRQMSSKWIPPDGIQRTMRTSFIVSGESTSSNAALRSRYPHIQVSAAKRKEHLGDKEREHLQWMEASKEAFFILGRFLHENRAEFVGLVQTNLEDWLSSPQTQALNERERMVHGICWASWQAMTVLIQSKIDGSKLVVVPSQKTEEFLRFMIEHGRASAADVVSETNINVFLTDLVTACPEDEIPASCFRLESELVEHTPGFPNQNRWLDSEGVIRSGWLTHRLYMHPARVINALAIYLRKSGKAVSLRQKDLRDQLSKMPFWISGKLQKRFGDSGDTTSIKCWGFDLDKMELARQECTDTELEAYLRNKDSGTGDPRLGPFYTIVHWLQKKRREQGRSER